MRDIRPILLIEDDPLSARLADLVLGSEGYQVIVAQNGIQGLRSPARRRRTWSCST